MYRKHVWAGLTLLMLAGCQAPVRTEVDGLVCASANRPVDLAPGAVVCKILPPLPAEGLAIPPANTLPMPTSLPPIQEAATRGEKIPNTVFDNLLLVSAQEPVDPPRRTPGGVTWPAKMLCFDFTRGWSPVAMPCVRP